MPPPQVTPEPAVNTACIAGVSESLLRAWRLLALTDRA